MNEVVKFAVKIIVGGLMIGTGSKLVKKSAENAKNIRRV